MVAPALLAMGTSFALAWMDRRERIAGGAVGALIGLLALSLVWPASPTGATTVLGAAAIVPLWYSGYRVARRGTRRKIRVGIAAMALIALVGLLAGSVLALTQRGALESAAADTEAAAAVIAAGETDRSRADFTSIADQFEGVESAAGSFWAAPAYLIPVVSQNARAIRVSASTGAELSNAAAELAGQVDYDSLAGPDGSLDVGRLSSYAPLADATRVTVAGARSSLDSVQSPWLLPPVASRLDQYLDRLDRAASATAVAADAAAELPGMLGAAGPQRYLVLLGSPSEARDLGGHIGNWAELTATDGRLDVVEVGRPYEILSPADDDRPALSEDLNLPASLVEMDPTRFPQNWGSSPDMGTVARLAADLFPKARGGAPIDGVIYADPTAFAALLSITGPVTVDGVTIGADNAVEFLTHGQYEAGVPDDAVSELVRAGLDKLVSEQMPGPARLAEAFGPSVHGGHLQFVRTGEDPSRLLRRTGLDQPIEARTGEDLVAVISRNANPSKIDAFLQRTIDYQIRWNPDTGMTTSRVVVTLHNAAPPGGLSDEYIGGRFGNPLGTNRTELSVLSPFDAIGAMIDGADAPLGRREDLDGLNRYSLSLDIAPGATRTVIFDLSGKVEKGPQYQLTWYRQPLPNDDVARVIVEPVDATLAGGQHSGAAEITDARIQRLRFLAAG